MTSLDQDRTAAFEFSQPPDLPVALDISEVTKTFGSVVALRDVSLQVRRGEVHGLVGENGAGKSTLMAVTAGVLRPDSGTVRINNVPVTGFSPAHIRAHGLSIVYQQPALLADLTVAENLMLGVADATRPRSYLVANRWAATVLAEQRLDIDPKSRVDELPLADRHLLEIAKATISEPKVLILDEPTEPLSSSQCEALFAQIRTARNSGVAIVYISHRLPDVFAICDRLTVLRDGSTQGTFEANELSEAEALRLIVGQSMSATFPPKRARVRTEEKLVVRGLSGQGFQGIDLTVSAGEVVGLAGIEGNGQEMFIRALGAVSPASGSIELDGRPVRHDRPREAIDAGIVYLPGDRHAEGLLTGMSVRENMTLLSLPLHSKLGFVLRGREQRTAERRRAALRIKMASSESKIDALSGGNQQKTLFARVLLAEPAVLLADEPTQGVDAGARIELYAELRHAADNGAAVIVRSSDSVEIAGLCDRVLVFSRGHVVRELEGADVTEHNITEAAVTSTSLREAGQRDDKRHPFRRLARGDHAPAVLIGLVALAVGAYTTVRSNDYLTALNFRNFLYLVAVLGFVAVAQSIVIMIGAIDLSVGPMLGFTTVVASYVLKSRGGPPIFVGLVVLLGCGLLVGLTNGLLVDRLRIAPVIATLVTFFSLQGVSLLLRLTAGGRITSHLSQALTRRVGFVPVAFVVLVIIIAALQLALQFTTWGLRLRAVGSDPGVARRVGINTSRTTIGAYLSCSVLALVGGLLFAALIQVGDPQAGVNYTLTSIAAVVLGGVAVAGGRGSFLGVFAGALVLQQTSNISTFLGLDSAWEFWFVGLLTLGAATIYSRARRA